MLDGEQPARVPDQVIAELRKRERNGVIELPKQRTLKCGDRVRILRGPFQDHLAIFADMKPRERVETCSAPRNALRWPGPTSRRSAMAMPGLHP